MSKWYGRIEVRMEHRKYVKKRSALRKEILLQAEIGNVKIYILR